MPVRWLCTLGKFVRRQPLGALGGLVCLMLLGTALFSSQIAPRHYEDTDFSASLEGPSADHPFGTDQLGRDVFSRMVYGSQLVVKIGFGAVMLGLLAGVVLGVASAYFGGWFDMAVQRLVDIFLAFPSIILIIVIVSLAGSGVYQLILVFGLAMALDIVRIIRAQALSIMEEQYLEAARTIGCSAWRMMTRHLLPNVVPLLLVLASVNIGSIILAESAVSFLGYGVPPPFPSWGQMLSAEGASHMREHPLLAVYPGLALGIVVFAFNVFGDAMRDVLDPRRRGQG